MKRVRIYQSSKSSMQSGHGKEKEWIMEFELNDFDPSSEKTSVYDGEKQLFLKFITLESALTYAHRNQLNYVVYTPSMRSIKPKSYGSKFTHSRLN